MILKMIHDTTPYLPYLTPSVHVVEAQQYNLFWINYDGAGQRDEKLAQISHDYYAPFPLAYDDVTWDEEKKEAITKTNAKGQCLVVRIIEPKTNTPVIVVESCHVFVMNEAGDTMDTFTVSSPAIPQPASAG